MLAPPLDIEFEAHAGLRCCGLDSDKATLWFENTPEKPCCPSFCALVSRDVKFGEALPNFCLCGTASPSHMSRTGVETFERDLPCRPTALRASAVKLDAPGFGVEVPENTSGEGKTIVEGVFGKLLTVVIHPSDLVLDLASQLRRML